KALPGGIAADTEFALTRFQQSLTFTDGGSNRTEAQIRAYREACPRSFGGGRNAAGMPFNPAGPDDPRCLAQYRPVDRGADTPRFQRGSPLPRCSARSPRGRLRLPDR